MYINMDILQHMSNFAFVQEPFKFCKNPSFFSPFFVFDFAIVNIRPWCVSHKVENNMENNMEN